MQIKPIMSGMFNSITVNNRIRLLVDKINELEARLDALAPVAPAEAETVTATVESETEFDLNTCDDPAELKAYALANYGLTITGNKKADTIRNEIKDHLGE